MISDPYDIEIDKRENVFLLSTGNSIIKTSDGKRTLTFKHLLNAESFLDEIRSYGNLTIENDIIIDPKISWYLIHSLNQMLIETRRGQEEATKNWTYSATFNDPIWRWQPGPEGIEHERRLKKVVKWLNLYGFRHTLLGAAYGEYKYPEDKNKLPEELYDFIYNYIESFSPYKLAVWNFLFRSTIESIPLCYGSIILPLLLVEEELTIREYLDAELVVNRALNSGWMDHNEGEKNGQKKIKAFLYPIIKEALEYLSEFDHNLNNILLAGESEFIEFKYGLLYNPFTKKLDSKNKFNSLKTIVAFLNTYGGKLLIGVDDSGVIVGIETDQFLNNDKFELALKDLIKDHIGIEAFNFIKTDFFTEKERTVCVVTCKKGNQEFFLRRNGETYSYKRILNSSQKIEKTN